MSVYAVIDTNVLVSALLSSHSDSSTVLLVKRMINGDLTPIFSVDMMNEYKEVLARKKFMFDTSLVSFLLTSISHFGLMVEPTPSGEPLPDMKDLPFFEVVMEKRKTDDAYLVTGNIKHFPIRPYIVTAKEMLDILGTSY